MFLAHSQKNVPHHIPNFTPTGFGRLHFGYEIWLLGQFHWKILAAPCIASYDQRAIHAASIPTHAVTSSVLQGGCQYLAVKMAPNTEAVSVKRPASATQMGCLIKNNVISLRSNGYFYHQERSPRAGHRNCPKNLRFSKRTDMTIHWKALEHFLTVPLVFRFNHFPLKNAFSELSSKIAVLKVLMHFPLKSLPRGDQDIL
jgi:hypothetical protein